MTEKEKYGLGVKCAALSIIVVQYSMSIVSPILGVINQHFAGQGYDVWMKQLETIGTLLMVITGLSVGFLLKYISKKTLLIIGTTIMLVFGVLPAIVGDSFWGIFISRAFLGFGMGIIYPFAASYIIDLFDGAERNSLMGIRSTVGAVAGILYAMATSNLCANFGYKASFYTPLVLIPILILIILKIPKDEVAKKVTMTDNQAVKENRLTKLSWIHILGNVIVMFCAYTFFTNIGIVVCSPVEVGGLGFAPTTAGNIMSVFSIVMAISGIMFSPVFLRFLSGYTTVFGAVLLGAGLLVGYNASNQVMIFLAAILFGFGFQIYNGSFVLSLATTTKPMHVAYVTAIFMAFNGIGQYLSSVIVPAIVRVAFTGNLRGDWLVACTGLFIFSAIIIVAQTVSGVKPLAKTTGSSR